MKHEDSGSRCLVGHCDGFGSCLKCSICGNWIRPQDWDEDCLGYIPTVCGYCDNDSRTKSMTIVSKTDKGIGTKINVCHDCFPKYRAGEEPIRKETWVYEQMTCSTCGNVIDGTFYWGNKDGKYYTTCTNCGMAEEDKIKFEMGELKSFVGEGAKKILYKLAKIEVMQERKAIFKKMKKINIKKRRIK